MLSVCALRGRIRDGDGADARNLLGAIGVSEVIAWVLTRLSTVDPEAAERLGLMPIKVDGSDTTSVVPGGREIGNVSGKLSGKNGSVSVTVVDCCTVTGAGSTRVVVVAAVVVGGITSC